MKIAQKKNSTTAAPPSVRGRFVSIPGKLSPLLFSWEMYLILFVAGFLRFYRINTTEFDDDQATLFRMAHDALTSGLLPATSNTASIGISHPPGVIYFFMLPASLSANPIWGVVMVAALSTASVLLTYIFARRYFGRLVATIAALCYATDAILLGYGRFIWQPNLMPLFIVLFLFVLYWGAIERHKGWLFPALLLLGLLYQMHEYALYLLVPLVVAMVLAPETLRWRDLVFAFIGLLVIFFPYLLWMFFTQFADLRIVETMFVRKARVDGAAFRLYRLFLSPYDRLPTHPLSVQRMLALVLSWLGVVVPLLAWGGMFVCASSQFLPFKRKNDDARMRIGHRGIQLLPVVLGKLRDWWNHYRTDSRRCSLLLLFVWQMAALLLLSRHANRLTWHYLMVLMPGPFLLIGVCIGAIVEALKRYRPGWSWLRYGVYVLTALIVLAQSVNSFAGLIDMSSGYLSDRIFPPYPYHNDLHSLQNALTEADRLAQQRHLHRIFITMDAATQAALRYLTEQRPSNVPPVTLFDASHCLVLPNVADGPVVLLVGPYDDLTNALLSQFVHATLVDRPARLGDAPFQLYIVQPNTARDPASPVRSFQNNLQLLDGQAYQLAVNNSPWLVTHWSMLRSEPGRIRTSYNYALTALLAGSSEQRNSSVCSFATMHAGDELFVAFHLPAKGTLPGSASPSSIAITTRFFMTVPYDPWYGPFHLETNNNVNTPLMPLQTTDGQASMTLQVSESQDMTSFASGRFVTY